MSSQTTLEYVFPADIDSGMSVEEVDKLVELAQGKVVLELGSFLGRSTIAMAQVAEIVHTVDWHRGDGHTGHANTLGEFIQNVWRYGMQDKIAMHVCQFSDFKQLIPPATLSLDEPSPFNLILVDGYHTYAAAHSDLLFAYRRLYQGGIVVAHDYGVVSDAPLEEPFEVTQAFLEVLGEPDGVVRTLAWKAL